MLDNVSIDIAVVLGTKSMPVHQVLRLGRGATIELGASEDGEVNILANNLPVARGKVAVNGTASRSRSANCRSDRSTCAEPTRRVPGS